MDVLKFDEVAKIRSIPFEKYFGEMPIDEEEKEKRISVAESLESAFEAFFILYWLYVDEELYEIQDLIEKLVSDYKNAIKPYITIDDYLDGYINDICKKIVDATIENGTKDYYTSDDRARYIAENESNTLCNYEQLQIAILQGNTHKQWIAHDDGHTRFTHLVANNQVSKIEEPFVVGGEFLMFPKDESLGASAKEIVNCRCCVEYFKN